jgi:hypothetical protein
MKRKKIDIDEILMRHLPKPSTEEIERSGMKVLERLREHLRNSPEEFTPGVEDTPATKAVRRLRVIDGSVLRAIQILEGKADLNKMLGIVNEIGDEVADLDDIMISLERLERKGAVSLKALFPTEPAVQEDNVNENEHFKARDWAKEKS